MLVRNRFVRHDGLLSPFSYLLTIIMNDNKETLIEKIEQDLHTDYGARLTTSIVSR